MAEITISSAHTAFAPNSRRGLNRLLYKYLQYLMEVRNYNEQ